MLVPAVLRPEEREDRQLEMVRFTLEQVDDTSELPVREAEGSMHGLFGDLPKIIEASEVSARVEMDKLPIPSSIRWNFWNGLSGSNTVSRCPISRMRGPFAG